MLRFAASPTSDMHIGDLRVALFNYIVAQQQKEDFLVRIEDRDKEKNIEGKDQEILDTLALFGIEHSQVIYQSESVRFHSAMALQLMHEKKAFSCFCSSEWLDKKRQEVKLANKTYAYDDACRNLPDELVIDNTSPFRIRIVRPDASIIIEDKIKGTVSYDRDTLDSFVILNQSKVPMDDFSCAVDDMLNNISLVIRDEKYMNNAPKQDHIRASLGYDAKIKYAHLPHISNAESLGVKTLLEEGFLPEAISNYLISIGNETPKKIFTLKESIQWFNLDSISKSPTLFDMDALRDINRAHLLNLNVKELSRYVGFADEEIGALARVYLSEVATTKELKEKIALIFEAKQIPKDLRKHSELMIKVIKEAPYFEKYEDFSKYVIEKSGLEDENFSEVLRYVLTGTQDGPDIAEIYKHLKNYIAEIVK